MNEQIREFVSDQKKKEFCESCEKNKAAEELHACPFAEEIYGDREQKCNCCDECTNRCLQDC